MLHFKSGKSEVLNESGREFHSFAIAMYEKECRPEVVLVVDSRDKI